MPLSITSIKNCSVSLCVKLCALHSQEPSTSIVIFLRRKDLHKDLHKKTVIPFVVCPNTSISVFLPASNANRGRGRVPYCHGEYISPQYGPLLPSPKSAQIHPSYGYRHLQCFQDPFEKIRVLRSILPVQLVAPAGRIIPKLREKEEVCRSVT